MSLYHEAASVLTQSGSEGGSLKSRVFGNKTLKSPKPQLYALVLETCKWSAVLKEVVDNSQLLQHEKKLTPALALLLTHDFLLSKGGIALPQSHGLRISIDRHKARITSELTRARLRRKCGSLDELRATIEAESRSGPVHPRWIRVNALTSSVSKQLESTFAGFESVLSVKNVIDGQPKAIRLDGNVPNLVAVAPDTDYTKTEAYKAGEIILQDKASCFPAYLLDPRPEDGDVIDACAAPGNKTTHLAAILRSRNSRHHIHAFEKDPNRAKTLEKMVKAAGSDPITYIHPGQDFLKTDPGAAEYKNVGALLLDPSCSGSGIVGRDDMPDLHLPEEPQTSKGKGNAAPGGGDSRKRKRTDDGAKPAAVMVDDDGETTVISSDKDLRARIEALASFQLSIIQHAMRFPAAKKITYSTCSVYAGENEHVVLKALESPIAKERGWRILTRDRQVRGMRDWPVRGAPEACDGNQEVSEGCIRTYMNDGHGVMGFFVAGFVREEGSVDDDDDPFVRDETGMIIRDHMGIPTAKATGKKVVDFDEEDADEDAESVEEYLGIPSEDEAGSRQAQEALEGQDMDESGSDLDDDDGSSDEWSGFDD
ncbi:S-adenosyl-L-methionine-dependent methyltransferase [Thozetella sp. PMI_491]|nr:S-adenosyl-L-methionine-dependent methyltransferase [Thozetella sp. PMI_491]